MRLLSAIGRLFGRPAETPSEQQPPQERFDRALWRFCESLPLGLIEADGNGTVLRFNRAAQRTLQRMGREQSGEQMLLQLARQGLWMRACAEPADEQGQPLALSIPGAQTENQLLLWTLRPADAEVPALILVFDNSEQARAQTRMERAGARLRHEIRLPVSVLQLQVDSNSEQWGALPDGQVTVMRVHKALERLRLLCERLPEMQGEPEAEAVHILPADIVREVADGYRPLAESRRQQLRLENCEQSPSAVGDGDLLRTALDNLLDNAVHHCPEGCDIALSLEVDEDELLIRIADEGPGIAEQEREQIFRPGFRSKARPPQVEGTGMGLTIARDCIGRLGGRLELEAGAGQGASFLLRLPLTVPGPDDGQQLAP